MFQTQVNINQAPGIEGDIASANSVFSEVSGAGAFVAGPGGVTVGRFAWIASDGVTVNNLGIGTPAGFIGRFQQALMNTFTDQYGMLIPAGMPVTILNRGDFLAKNYGTVSTVRAGSVYANASDGKASYGSTGSNLAASVTASIAVNLSASTCSITANTFTGSSISGTTFTLATVGAGAAAPGMTLTGTGVASGTKIVKQLTGATAGAAGTYQVNISQTVASTTITGSGGCFTVVTQTTGTVWVGGKLSGGATDAATTVLANITGSGGAGKYWVSVSQAISSQAITCSGGTLTVTVPDTKPLGIDEIIVGGTTGSYIIADGTVAGSNVTGAGYAGTYIVSVSETVASGTVTTAASVDTGWKWANVVAAGEIGKISTHTR